MILKEHKVLKLYIYIFTTILSNFYFKIIYCKNLFKNFIFIYLLSLVFKLLFYLNEF